MLLPPLEITRCIKLTCCFGCHTTKKKLLNRKLCIHHYITRFLCYYFATYEQPILH